MWTRRDFLETLSGMPLVGGFIGASALPVVAAAAGKSRDYFRDLGVRPFINAAGTYTAMTASLMPEEVIEAITYASKQYVMLDDLHDKVGQRIATLVKSEAAMVTSGAASALTLGTAASADRNGSPEDGRSARPDDDEERGHHPEVPPLRLRPRRPQLRREAGGSGDGGGSRARRQPEDGDDALLQQQQQRRKDSGRRVRPAWQEARRPHVQRRGGRRPAGRQPVEVHRDGFRPRGHLRRQGYSRTAERRTCCSARKI